MSAQAVLKALETLGCKARVDGDQLHLSANAPPPAELLERVRQHKAQLIELLRAPHAWDATDWRDFYEERAAICKFDAGLSRVEAERQAFEHCVARWLAANAPVPPDGTLCVQCGGDTTQRDLALAIGAWMHARCHEPFLHARRAAAIHALRSFGIFDASTSEASLSVRLARSISCDFQMNSDRKIDHSGFSLVSKRRNPPNTGRRGCNFKPEQRLSRF